MKPLKITKAELRALIYRVEAIRKDLDKGAPHHRDNLACLARDKAAAEMTERIVAECGASFRKSGAHDHYLRIAGITSSSTSGSWGMVRNWLVLARRRLAEMENEP